MSKYESPYPFINNTNNLYFKNYNYKEYNNPINNPQKKYNSFVQNGKRILSEANDLPYKITNQNSNKKGHSFFQNPKFSGTDNLTSQTNVYSFIQDNKRNKILEDFSNYNFYQNKNNYRSLDVKEKNIINDYENNNNIEEKLNLIISSQIGLKNLGYTCYMNACLQNLIHSKYFIRELLSKRSIINESKTPITKEFLKLCEKMSTSKTSSIDPSDFRYIFCKKHKEFGKYAQFDTIEFCRYLLEDISSELNEIKVKTPYRELSTVGKSKIQCYNEFWQFYVSKEYSIVVKCFYGSFINIFTCTCNHKTYSFQVFLDFPLLIPEGMNKTSIDELLFQYFKKESINFNTKCEKCYIKTVHDKEIKFSELPNILILSLQRMDARTNKKNNCKIKFEEKLILDDYIDNECQKGEKYIYYLYGVWCHRGIINDGHYYSYIKINDKYWYEFNDSKVNNVGYIETMSKDAYVLLYKKTKRKQLRTYKYL